GSREQGQTHAVSSTTGAVSPEDRVPDRMSAGYSRSSQTRKLGLKPGDRLGLDEPPPGWRLEDEPPGVVAVRTGEPADVLIAFFRAASELESRLPGLVERIRPDGGLWIA